MRLLLTTTPHIARREPDAGGPHAQHPPHAPQGPQGRYGPQGHQAHVGPRATAAPRVDVLVDADGGASVAQLAESLDPLVRVEPRAPGRGVDLYLGAQRIEPGLTLSEAGLHDGAVVTVGGPGPAVEEPPGVVEIRVVSGERAGLVFRVDPGDYTVGLPGDGAPSDVPVDTDGVWARVRVAPDASVTVLRTGGGDRANLEGDDVAPDAAWPPGHQLLLGDTLFEAWPNTRPDAAVNGSDDGAAIDYSRPPRLHPAPNKTKFRLPAPPEPPDRPLAQLAVMIMMPLVLAVGGALVMGRPQYLAIGLISPISVVFMQLLQRRTGKAKYDREMKEFHEKTERIKNDAHEALITEQRRLRDTAPDPAAVLLLATGPRARLWERRPVDEDFTLLRVGTGTVPSQVVLNDPTRDAHRQDITWNLHDVPATVSVRDNGVVGCAGRGERFDALERWLVAQLAALHSPAELQLYLLSLRQDHERWAWTRFLPHLRSEIPNSYARTGMDAETCARRISELLAELEARRGAPRGAMDDAAQIVVVLDGARRLRSLPGVVQLLREGPSLGIHVLCLETDERMLPEECQAVVSLTPDGLELRRTTFDDVEDIRPDGPSAEWAERLGRALAPLRDSSVSDDGAALPRSARLLDVIGLEPPNGEAIAAHWASNGRSTIATLGAGLDGPFSVDVRRDGPHALIAGTTGSGKSELLQTLVASLAAVNRPESMSFVLVDYKGGSAFKDCVDLPHTVGMVTDLDTHLVGRALVSLGAELHRREHILAQAGAKDIEDYLEYLDRDPSLPQMPRLMIVIDEFASLARELPDFVKGLVNIAQRGRSLGIHMVLATQRPAGVVTSDIRANTNLRIALRMTDAGESRDVIDAAESAQIGIDTPGRAYARLGAASLLPFQSGRVGGRRVVASTDAPAPAAYPVRWTDLALPPPAAGPQQADKGDVEVTDLTVLVGAVRQAAEQIGAERQPSPWLQALPERLSLAELNRSAPLPQPEAGRVQPVPVALMDLPAEQAQRAFALDLENMGHLHVIGSGRSGRSQALRTIAGALALCHHPGDVHMYGIDCGNGALLPMEGLPHCGSVAGRTQQERVVRLLGLLGRELEERQKRLAAEGCANLHELRTKLGGREKPAHIVLFIDRWEAFEQAFGEYNYGALLEDAVTLMRDGAGVGIHVIVTGDKSLARNKYASTTEHRLVLRCNDRGDYSSVGLSARDLPEAIPDGRAYVGGEGTELQFALLCDDPQGGAQAQELANIAAFTTRRTPPETSPAPMRVDVLPDQLTFAETERYLTHPPRPLWGLVGVGGNELTALGADLAETPTFLISGPPKSGRSSLLLSMAQSLLIGGTELLLVTPRASALGALRGHPGVPAVLDMADPKLGDLHKALGRFEGETAVVMVDDAELLLHNDIGKEFTRIARGMVGKGWAIVAAGTNEALQGGFSAWHVHLKRNRMGALLSPQAPVDGEVLGLRLPKGVPSSRLTPGTAYLHLGDGQIRQVKVPLPHGVSPS
ncbi:FtsK/SpoIIIE domain-containing protein [Nocardiopsis sp. RSe5-2]|uniref:FtsK/SpoIIIE domain-containing protein n=1 Tax=Nocardiopsis endophytica TaxID=3018445 RepID=A0ABT4U5Z8_9ACTN|nr:FtsK/SpoIIIE domain-containing protein [Nocardiopsis endophytica]MDA2811865.1 FtsK/SpoIIIE domain-containing protein [Nocardiopsis endophytica]